jgi:hypothetical protein
MIQNSELDAFNLELAKAQAECDAIEAELSLLQHGEPGASFKYFNLVGRRRLIGERLLAAVEALGSAGSLAPEMPLERDTAAYESVAASAGQEQRGPGKTRHPASHALG